MVQRGSRTHPQLHLNRVQRAQRTIRTTESDRQRRVITRISWHIQHITRTNHHRVKLRQIPKALKLDRVLARWDTRETEGSVRSGRSGSPGAVFADHRDTHTAAGTRSQRGCSTIGGIGVPTATGHRFLGHGALNDPGRRNQIAHDDGNIAGIDRHLTTLGHPTLAGKRQQIRAIWQRRNCETPRQRTIGQRGGHPRTTIAIEVDRDGTHAGISIGDLAPNSSLITRQFRVHTTEALTAVEVHRQGLRSEASLFDRDQIRGWSSQGIDGPTAPVLTG